MKFLHIGMLFILATLSVGKSLAGTDTSTEDEKRYLISIAEKLGEIEQLAAKAQSSADPQARISLDYVALNNDIKEIRRALEQHINLPSRSPRKIDSLEFSR